MMIRKAPSAVHWVLPLAIAVQLGVAGCTLVADLEDFGPGIPACEDGSDQEALRDEAGDLLFAVVNLVRHAGAEPESVLRRANRKFTKRFQQVELLCHQAGTRVTETDLDTLDWYWDQVKMEE